MSLREKQQMNLDTESAAYTGMEGPSRCSHKYLLLQVWCGLLTVAMVVMAALLTSIKPKSTEVAAVCSRSSFPVAASRWQQHQDEVSTLKPDVSPTVSTIVAPFKSIGSSLSYIQLHRSLDSGSTSDKGCQSCSLVLRDGSIYCTSSGLYFIYAQVAFSKRRSNQTKSVMLKRNASEGRSTKKLIEGSFPNITVGSVWVAKMVKLDENDSVSLDITGDFLSEGTFWGAFQLH